MQTVRLKRLLAALIGVVLLVDCGARTGLILSSELVDSGTPALGCTPGTFTLTKANPAVMLVLDRSKSMESELGTSSPGASRWTLLTSALSTALPPVDSSMQIGALLFPADGTSGTQNCAVPAKANLAPALGRVSAIVALLQGASPGGATPTAAALDAAATMLLGVRASTTARAMVLATDGAPDCNAALDPNTCTCVGNACSSALRCLDDTRTIQRIAYHKATGIPTYVIGIQDDGDTEYSSVLDAMAEAGGRAQTGASQRYYAARSPAELNAAFVRVRDQVGACTYLTSSVPDENGKITVILGEEVLVESPEPTEDWEWEDRMNGQILLKGEACERAASEANPVLVAIVECGDQ